MEKEQDDDLEGKRGRSPSYPFISIKKAIERIEALNKSHGKAAARAATIASAWEYAPKSSGLLQTLSALKQYGLIEDIGRGPDRKIQLTDLAWRLLKDKRPGVIEASIDEAIRKPKLMAEYLPLWYPERPNDSHCISELQIDRGFTEDAAKSFIKVFDENVAADNLAKTDNIVYNSEDGKFPEPTIKDGPKPMHQAQTLRSVSIPNRAIFPLPEGTAMLELPEGLSKESHEDLKAWFELMLKRASRPIAPKSDES